jgi:anaerobic selenocysteine-containing dehydrogenase
VSAGQPCDITGIEDFRMLDECGGVQWPLPNNIERETKSAKPERERRLFADGKFFHADSKARFVFETPRPAPEQTSKEFPFVLLTGRGTSAQWHTGTRTGKSDVLRKLHPANIYVEISGEDAARLRIESGARVRVRSPRAEVIATAFVAPSVAPGQVFIPMHYAETNHLTLWHVDPYSRQPSYKSCAVAVCRA